MDKFLESWIQSDAKCQAIITNMAKIACAEWPGPQDHNKWRRTHSRRLGDKLADYSLESAYDQLANFEGFARSIIVNAIADFDWDTEAGAWIDHAIDNMTVPASAVAELLPAGVAIVE